MTQVGMRCEGEEGAWQQILGWTRGKPGCTLENPANLLKSCRLREMEVGKREWRVQLGLSGLAWIMNNK